MKSIYLILSFVLFSKGAFADGATISGIDIVESGATETYTVSFSEWDNTYEYHANVAWNITGGTIISSDNHSVVIQWNTLQGYLGLTGTIEVTEDLTGQSGYMNVTIENNATSTSDFCSGILGNPVVAVNFGSGSNPGPSLPAGTTTYQFNNICALEVGQYTVRSNSINCRSLWHNISQDHTGNPGGYFLMINSNSSRNEIYRTQVNNLLPSFRYEFSAWVGNLYNNNSGQDPKIRFEIYDLGGILIGSSGSIDVPVTIPFAWQKAGFMFDLPSIYTSVIVVLVNTRPSTDDQGNDLVVDDISFAPCYPGILASFSNTSIVDKARICNTGTVNLFGSWPSAIPFTNPSFQWQKSANGANWTNIPGATTINYTITEPNPGLFQYRIYAFETSNPSLNVTSNTITYFVQTLAVDAVTTTIFSCAGNTASGTMPGNFQFLYSDPAEASTQNYTYNWSPSIYVNGSNQRSPTVIVPALPAPPAGATGPNSATYLYTFTVTNTNYNCTGSNVQTLKVSSPRKVGIPNTFAPAAAPPNNVFVPINIEDQLGSEVWVWNRWGQNIFYSNGPTKAAYSWNGTYQGVPQPTEVYGWAILLTGCPTYTVNGNNVEGVRTGDVTLLR